jgi:hypothetical protein
VFVTVTVDDRPVRADVYIGQPTENQAEAIALVQVPGAGDYFLDFEEERYREASDHEFIRLGNNVWTLKSMRDGRFLALLPFENSMSSAFTRRMDTLSPFNSILRIEQKEFGA